MKRVNVIILFSLLVFSGNYSVLAQVFSKPKSPIFDYLTLDPATGTPTLFWTAPSFDPQYPNPTGYIIYRTDNGVRLPIDTVNNTTFTYTDFTATSNTSRLIYTIASNGPTEPSQLTTDHSNIFLTSEYDSCNKKINLIWNLYQGWNNSLIAPTYDVYIGNNSNWATFPLTASVDRFSGRYIINNVSENQDYYAYVTAKRNDTSFVTYSNLHHVFTKMAIHPSNMSIDSIIAEDVGNRVYFTIDPNTELERFKLVRWEVADTIKSIFSAKDTLYKFFTPSETSYFDQSDSWASRTRSFFYKIDAMNGCVVRTEPNPNKNLYKVVSVSNLANSIITKVYAKKGKNEINWTPFIDTLRYSDNSNSLTYRITRYIYLNGTEIIDDIYDTLITNPTELYSRDINDKYNDIEGVNKSTRYIDDITDYEWQGYSQTFCYQVEALANNFGGTVTYSRSRKVCTEVVPGVTMPDAIKPNDPTVINGHARNIFAPVINFEANYTLFVYSRWGEAIFEGIDQGWDGRSSNGEFVKQGSYLYRLVIHTSGNRDVIKVGNVTVVY